VLAIAIEFWNLFRLVIHGNLFNKAAALVKLKWNRFGIADDIWLIIILIIVILEVFLVLSKSRKAIFHNKETSYEKNMCFFNN